MVGGWLVGVSCGEMGQFLIVVKLMVGSGWLVVVGRSIANSALLILNHYLTVDQ